MARVLLVDDDADQLEIRAQILEAHGHEIQTAVDPAEALSRVALWAADVVVMDLRLPTVEDGHALIQRLPSKPRVIVLTGNASGQRDLPVFRVIEKPCPAPRLLAAISEALRGDGAIG